MQKILMQEAEKYAKQNHRRRIWRKIVRVMACVVVFCTTYALILPAITLEKTQCGLNEHTHSESCYEKVAPESIVSLDCTYESLGVHVHTSDCYDEENHLLCGQADFLVHEHDASCVDASGVFVCRIPEISEHAHTDSCYAIEATEPTHVHEDSCYSTERGALICQLTETDGHAHEASCFTQGQLLCQLAEQEGHTHGEGCSETVLICSLTVEPHVHNDSCYQQMTCDISEGEEHTHTEGCSGTVLICDLTEQPHTHTDVCYQTNYLGGLTETEGHAHDASCYESLLTCELTEEECHLHTDSCYELVSVLTCQLEEGTSQNTAVSAQEAETEERSLVCEKEVIKLHSHDDTQCYETYLDEGGNEQKRLICTELIVLEHVHSESCFVTETVEAEDEDALTCTITEGHVHVDGCYDENGSLICTEAENHVHINMCYGTWELICGKEEHTHDLVCQNDPEADVETEDEWMATFADAPLTGEWDEDLISIARSQLGYQESTRNYEVMEDGETIKGYTRYGDWYGISYGDWCAMFVSFCLNYAEIPRDAIPYEANCPDWIEALQNEEYDLYRSAGEYTPVPGDLVFFDWEEDGISDHVGIVTESIPATEEEPAKIKTIEGNTGDRVAEQEYDFADVVILGYAKLPEKPPAYYCGLQEHTHSESCADENGELICGIAEHTHTDECLSETVYSCGLKGHIHVETCWDENGELVCGMEEHTHSVECNLPPELSEEDRTAVADVIRLIDALPTYDEIMARLDEFYEADDTEGEEAYLMEIYAQVEDAYRAYMALDDDLQTYVTNADKLMELEFIWSRITLEEPVQSYNLEGGEYLFPAKEGEFPRFYQRSSYAIGYEVNPFVLIPASELEDGEWTAAPVDWNGSANANYLVAYCSDDRTGTSPTDQDTYRTYSIDNSRFTTDLQQRQIAAIIGNSYPFLTLAEARAVMAAAGVEGAQQCTEHELLTATQWAVWATVETVEADKLVESDLEYVDISGNSTLNPLQAAPAMDDAVKAHIINVKNWLCSLAEPEKLAVTKYNPVITANEDGTFNLSITVNLNRAIVEDEHAQFHLQAGSKSTTVTELPAGQNSFTISAENLTEAEVANAKVNLNISGQHMQAYFFDSNYYQDMVSGQWEYYSEDITVELGLGEIDVAVTKVWTEENTTVESIDVQLLADGKPYGAPVTLSKNNDWHYIWKDLKRYNVTELNKAEEDRTEIEYSIMEVPLSGYYSSDLTVDSFDSVAKVQQWQEVETFDGPGKYVIVSEMGALGTEYLANPPSGWRNCFLTMVPVDLSSVSLTDDRAIWDVTVADETDGTYYLKSAKYGWYYQASMGRMHQTLKTGLTFVDSTLCYYDEYYFDGPSNRGYHEYSANKEEAMPLRLYKLVEMELPSAGKNFVLTNTKIQQDTPTVDVSVTKKWLGRMDMAYPDVTVQLMQKDVFDDTWKPYGYPVVLKLAGNTNMTNTYTWSGLPEYILKDDTNHPIEYKVVEVDVPDDYESKVTQKSGTYEFTITNTWKPETVNVELQKTDSGTSRLLPGAEFTLYWTTNNKGVAVPGTTGVKGYKKGTFVTDATGKVSLTGLNPGETYYLAETKAPEGYEMLDYAIGFTVIKNGSYVKLTLLTGQEDAEVVNGSAPVLKIQNQIFYELPETGGPGTTLYTMAGLVLICFSMAYLMYRPKARGREEFESP